MCVCANLVEADVPAGVERDNHLLCLQRGPHQPLPVLVMAAGAHGDQSHEGREIIPTGWFSHVRGERIYLQDVPVKRGERDYTYR
eukprot:716985-Pyramimonas_sp.AAC.1